MLYDFEIEVGMKVLVKMDKKSDSSYYEGSVLAVKKDIVQEKYYIHYKGYNNRLDRWVSKSLINMEELSKTYLAQKKKIKTKKTLGLKKKKLKAKEAAYDKGKDKPQTGAKKIISNEIYRVKNIKYLYVKGYRISCWYFSPYPEFFADKGKVYCCEFCFFYLSSKKLLKKHYKNCKIRHPPGNEIYRNGNLSFFECDGHIQKNYCQNITLICKLFLDHKTLVNDVSGFYFYILCRYEKNGYHMVGYFSKEKKGLHNYNLSCILILPYEQNKGYGKFMIEFSYCLSLKEGKFGTPEKPLSDLGLLSYHSFWKENIYKFLLQNKRGAISELSKKTGIIKDDLLRTMTRCNIIRVYNNDPIFVYDDEAQEKYKNKKNLIVPKKIIRVYKPEENNID